jgi:hypothetical protein
MKMEIVGDANGVHEAARLWQVHTGIRKSEGKVRPSQQPSLSREISAHRSQHAFDPTSTNNLY